MTHEAYLRKAYPSLASELDRLKAAKVPASFTDNKPDTPEARAARWQNDFAGGES